MVGQRGVAVKAAMLLFAGFVLLGLLAPASRAATGPVPVQVYLTNPNLGSAALSAEPDVSFSNRGLPRGVRSIDVDDHRGYQSIIGFGAAMTDTSAWLLHTALSPGVRKHIIDELFSPNGFGLDFVRVPVGASDFTSGASAYTYDDQPAGHSDPTLSDFSIAHDLSYVIPTLQQMLKVNPAIDVISTEWTAPAWMKTNDSTGDVNRSGVLRGADYPVLAAYLARFIQAYASAGIPIWAITPENEPETNVSYPSMFLTPAQEAQFIAQDLAPIFAADQISTRIYGGDTGSAQPSFADSVQTDPAASAAVSGEAWHCYGGQQGITAFHDLFPAVQELMTECSPGIIPYTGGEAVIDAMRNWASSAALWNIALDPSGGPVQAPNEGCQRCTGLLTIDESTHQVTSTLNLYQLGQVSKFVERGAVRIATPRWVSDYISSTGFSEVSEGLDNVAFLNPDGSRVLVADNHSPAPITFGVSWNNQQFAYTLGAGSMVTFKWTGTESGTPVNVAATSACLNAGVRYVPAGGQVHAEPDC